MTPRETPISLDEAPTDDPPADVDEDTSPPKDADR